MSPSAPASALAPTPSTATAATPPSPAASTEVAQCGPADIAATAGPVGGAAGSRGADVAVSAVGGASCQLPALPVVGVVDSRGTVLLRSKLPLTADGPLISPTTSESFSLLLGNWCDEAAAMPLHFVLALATDSVEIGGVTMAGDALPPCNGPGQPAVISTDGWQHP